MADELSNDDPERVPGTQEPDVDDDPDCVPGTQDDDIPMGENSITARLHELRTAKEYGHKVAFQAMLETAKLLRMVSDKFGKRGKVYETYADTHCGVKKKDAHTLWHLGAIADKVLAHYDSESVLSSRFEWPHWRAAARKFLPKPPPPKTTDDPVPDDPIAALTRQRDDLQAQVRAITQQFRSERAKCEEVAEQLATAQRERDEAIKASIHWEAAYRHAAEVVEAVAEGPEPDNVVPFVAPEAKPDPAPTETVLDWMDDSLPPVGERTMDYNKPPVGFPGKPGKYDQELAELRQYALHVIKDAGLPLGELVDAPKKFWLQHRDAETVREIWLQRALAADRD